MVLLQTVLHQEDLVSLCIVDPTGPRGSIRALMLTGRSSRPERFPTKELLAERRLTLPGATPHLDARMECKVVSDDLAAFREDWLRFWTVLPEDLVYFIGIDPVPPPRTEGTPPGDYEAIAVVGVRGGEFYLADYSLQGPYAGVDSGGDLPASWTSGGPSKSAWRAWAYQRTLKWLIEQEMRRRGRYFQVDAEADRRRSPTGSCSPSLGPSLAGPLLRFARTQGVLFTVRLLPGGEE